MPSAAHASVRKEVVALPLARIDAQDEPFVAPLREFLSARGCDVVVNRHAVRPATYHLICGDLRFVKEILNESLPPAQRRLVILWHLGPPDIQLPAVAGARIILVDARPLSDESVQKIFSFLFTGRKEILDIRKQQGVATQAVRPVEQLRREAPPVPSVPPRARPHPPAAPPPFAQDAQRVSQAIADIFGARTHARPAKEQRPHKHSLVVRSLAAGVGLLLALWCMYVACVGASAGLLVAGGKMLLAGNMNASGRMIAASRWFATQAGWLVPVTGGQLGIIGIPSARAHQEQIVGLLSESSSAAAGVHEVLRMGQTISSTLFHPDGAVGVGSAASDIAALRTEINSVQNHLALSQAQLNRLPLPRPLSSATTTLVRLRQTVSYLDQLLTLFPHMAGFSEPQTYLLLFQNSMELRPTGGFIGSIATATFDSGRLDTLEVQDVYALDGQLKGHVDPPLGVKELLGQEHWYLRDSNWDPDFKNSATQAAWFYDKEAGKQVDGVIGISVPFIIDLLRATGPITLTDFNDRITADNFFGKSLLYTQADFFPGSTQKKDFLGSLASTLIRRITTEEGANPGALLNALIAGLEAKNILFYFPDEELQALVSQYGWAGEMAPLLAEGTDGLAVVEANVGVNKANYFVTRDALHQVALSETGAATHMVTLRYHNAATDNPAEGGGTYRAYLRLLMPAGSRLQTVSVNGIALALRDPTRGQAAALPFVQLEPGSPDVVSVVFDVPPLADTQVTLSWLRDQAVRMDEQGGTYDLLVRKQPGYRETTWQTNILYPLFWLPTVTDGSVVQSYVANQGRLEYNTTLLHDAHLSVRFDK